MKSLIIAPFALVLLSLPMTPSLSPSKSATVLGEHDWVVDAGHSSVVFRVKHANAAWFKGSFDVINGSITLDPSKPEAGAVKLSIPIGSVDTNDSKRDDHLKGPDFFNAKENPEITFTSTKIQKKGDAFEVTGKLAMAGKTKEMAIVVEKTGEGEFYGKRAGFSSTFTLKRSEFGMTYGVDKNVLGDEVTLMIDLELTQPK